MKRILTVRQTYSEENREIIQGVDMIDLKYFIGLSYFNLAFKSGYEDDLSWFATDGDGCEWSL